MRFRTLIFTSILTASAALAAEGQTATQTVTFQVDAINQIGITGSAPSLTINTATAGSAPASVSSSGITWAVTTNQTGAKVTGSIASNMPSGVTLKANLAAPSGGATAGATALSTTAADLVTGITKLSATALSLTYTLEATAAAGVVNSASRVVTFTITGGS